MAASFGKRQSFGQRPVERYTYVRPAAVAAPSVEPAAVALHPPKIPFFTAGLTLALCAIYAGQIYLTGEAFGFRDAVTWGGIDRHLVADGHEWWRVLTAPWLHGSIDHLIGNLIALIVAGAILERHIGTAWLAAIYFAGGIGGSIGSMVMNDPRMVSVGASGAIMALVTLVFALTFHVCLQDHARRLRRLALFTIIPALAPSAAHGVQEIDVGAHFGGFVVGMTAAYLLLVIWNESEPLPAGRLLARGFAVATGLLALFAGLQVAQHAPAYAERAKALAPVTILSNDEAVARDSIDLLLRYPHDPVLRLVLAIQAMKERRYGDAESHARAGRDERDLLTTFFPHQIDDKLQAALALALLGERRIADAIEAAQPVCNVADYQAILQEAKLCPAP